MKFPDATAAGFVAGRRNGITVIDIDSTDDGLVQDVQERFGRTPLQVRTPSGGRHLYFRHGGETRAIRAIPDVDILGAGNVVAALSVVPKGRYSLERGSLVDLDRLPTLRADIASRERAGRVPNGKRNKALFRYCHDIVVHCDTLDQLIDAACTWASNWLEKGTEPVTSIEIIKTANNVWRFREGRKRVIRHIVNASVFSALSKDPAVMGVFAYLSAENGSNAEFMLADGLAQARGWPRRIVPYARKTLLNLGIIECVRQRGKNTPALYRWAITLEDTIRHTESGR